MRRELYIIYLLTFMLFLVSPVTLTACNMLNDKKDEVVTHESQSEEAENEDSTESNASEEIIAETEIDGVNWKVGFVEVDTPTFTHYDKDKYLASFNKTADSLEEQLVNFVPEQITVRREVSDDNSVELYLDNLHTIGYEMDSILVYVITDEGECTTYPQIEEVTKLIIEKGE